MISGIIVRIGHIRATKRPDGKPMCMRSAREWMPQHVKPWQEFLDHGAPVEDIEATGDAFALRVAEVARNEADGR